MSALKHIVLIPDGNRRWARQRGLPDFFGHRQGAKTTEKILKAALDMKIPYFTFWASSLENIIKRPEKEVGFLFDVFEKYFQKIAKDKYWSKTAKINVIGRWREFFPKSVKTVINAAIVKTKNNQSPVLTFLMAYSGTDEMTNAVQEIAEIKNKKSRIKIDGNLIKANLWTSDLPAVDLVIRTGGQPHWSAGLMMWDTADSQFYFTDTLYPDFSAEEFKKAIANFQKTERRFGK